MRRASVTGLVFLSLAGCGRAPEPAAAPPAAPVASAQPHAERPPVHIQLLALNDFHGNLAPPLGTSGMVTVAANDPWLAAHPGVPATPSTDSPDKRLVPAGGAAYLATMVKRLRAENPNTVVVSAGDLTGASPLVSNLFLDEPTVLAMNLLGLDFEGVGNHDFDRGLVELERLARGGCSMGDCKKGQFVGAHYTYLSSNVHEKSGQTPFAPFALKDVAGVRLAFVADTLEATAQVTVPNAVKDLTFSDEAKTVNALVPDILAQRADAIILLIHQGAHQVGGTYDSCEGLGGDLLPILGALDPHIDVVVSAHTHQAYDCTFDIPGGGKRLVTSAASYGRLLTRYDLVWDPEARRWLDKRAKNLIVSRDVPPDPDVERLLADYQARATPITSRVVGYVKGSFTRGQLGDEPRPGEARACESPAGELIADAQLSVTKDAKAGGAVVAFMNPGGVRTDLFARTPTADHAITYADAFEMQPFGNRLVTMTLTGAQIERLLVTQGVVKRLLQVSAGFTYRLKKDPDPNSTTGLTIEPGSVRIQGKPLDPKKEYRVTVNSFLAAGGDGFSVLREGKDAKDGPLDIDALTEYLGKSATKDRPLEPGPLPLRRIAGDVCR